MLLLVFPNILFLAPSSFFSLSMIFQAIPLHFINTYADDTIYYDFEGLLLFSESVESAAYFEIVLQGISEQEED